MVTWKNTTQTVRVCASMCMSVCVRLCVICMCMCELESEWESEWENRNVKTHIWIGNNISIWTFDYVNARKNKPTNSSKCYYLSHHV